MDKDIVLLSTASNVELNPDMLAELESLRAENQSLKTELEAARKDLDGLLNLLIGAETLFACICSDSTSSNWLDDSRAAIEQAKGGAA